MSYFHSQILIFLPQPLIHLPLHKTKISIRTRNQQSNRWRLVAGRRFTQKPGVKLYAVKLYAGTTGLDDIVTTSPEPNEVYFNSAFLLTVF